MPKIFIIERAIKSSIGNDVQVGKALMRERGHKNNDLLVNYEKISYVECLFQILDDRQRMDIYSLLKKTGLDLKKIISIDSVLSYDTSLPDVVYINEIIVLTNGTKKYHFNEIKIQSKKISFTTKVIRGGCLINSSLSETKILDGNEKKYFDERDIFLIGIIDKIKKHHLNLNCFNSGNLCVELIQGPEKLFFRKHIIKKLSSSVEYMQDLVCFDPKDVDENGGFIENVIVNTIPSITSNSKFKEYRDLHTRQIIDVIENKKGKKVESRGVYKVHYFVSTKLPGKMMQRESQTGKYLRVENQTVYFSHSYILFWLKRIGEYYISDRIKALYGDNYLTTVRYDADLVFNRCEEFYGINYLHKFIIDIHCGAKRSAICLENNNSSLR